MFSCVCVLIKAFLLLSLLSLPCISAQSRVSQAVTAYLSNSTSLRGQAVRLSAFNLQIISNETAAVVTFNLTKTAVRDVGWLAYGTGSRRMYGSDMLVAYPTFAGTNVSWTLSQRTAGGHVMPEANIQQPTREISLLPKLTSLVSGETSYTLLSFLRPLQPKYETDALSNEMRRATTDIIYAYSDTSPDSSKFDAPLGVHDSYGTIQMELANPVRGTVINSSAAKNTTSSAPNGIGPSDDGSDLAPVEAEASTVPWTRTDDIVVIHALSGSLAWLIVSPSAILLARLGRNYAGWVKIHQGLQAGLTTGLTIVSFSLGCLATSKYSGLHFKSTHQTLGLVLLLLLLLQVGLGFYIHHLFDSRRLKRPLRNLFHIVLGLSATTVGLIQIYKGFQAYDEKGRLTPIYIKVIYYIAIAAFTLLFVASSVQLAWQRKQQGLPLKDAALGLGRITRNNAAATKPYAVQNPGESDFSLTEVKQPSGWQHFQEK